MSKSIKLNDNNYWDSTGIVHNQQILSDYLNASKIKTIWSGELYGANDSITLDDPLKFGKLYLFQFYGISSTYQVFSIFFYNINYFQYSYNDGTDYFRYRLNITNGGKVLTVDSASKNNQYNTRLVNIKEIDI